MPTVADFAPEVTEACSAKSLPTYKPHFRRLVEAHGDLRLDEVTPAHLEALRDRVITKAGTDKINRALATGRPLLSYELDAHAHGAGENSVRAMRFSFEHARKQRITRDNPAMGIRTDSPTHRRPLRGHRGQRPLRDRRAATRLAVLAIHRVHGGVAAEGARPARRGRCVPRRRPARLASRLPSRQVPGHDRRRPRRQGANRTVTGPSVIVHSQVWMSLTRSMRVRSSMGDGSEPNRR